MFKLARAKETNISSILCTFAGSEDCGDRTGSNSLPKNKKQKTKKTFASGTTQDPLYAVCFGIEKRRDVL